MHVDIVNTILNPEVYRLQPICLVNCPLVTFPFERSDFKLKITTEVSVIIFEQVTSQSEPLISSLSIYDVGWTEGSSSWKTFMTKSYAGYTYDKADSFKLHRGDYSEGDKPPLIVEYDPRQMESLANLDLVSSKEVQECTSLRNKTLETTDNLDKMETEAQAPLDSEIDASVSIQSAVVHSSMQSINEYGYNRKKLI